MSHFKSHQATVSHFKPPWVGLRIVQNRPRKVVGALFCSEAWGPPQFQEKRSRREKAILGALVGVPWEVLNGVGVDGVGGVFPFFTFFLVFFFFDKGEQLQFTAKMGNFTPTPSAPTPCATSRVPGYSRSSSSLSEFEIPRGQESRNGIPRLEQYENHNDISRSNSESDSRNCWEPT